MSVPIQIVDAHDLPIGVASIPEVHEKGLIHRVARIMIENSNGDILLQKRAQKMTWPNCWDNSAAGHVDAGEDYITAAKRELFEEIGMKDCELIEVGSYYQETKYKGRILKRFNRLYRVISEETPTKLDPKEVTEVKWVTLQELKSMIKSAPDDFTDGLKDVVERYY